MKLTVNGQARAFDAPARTHLADLLRDQLGLTGTHLGCEQGVCGACTVLLDGAPARACLLYAHEAAGHDITTIEGLDDDPLAAELRAAFTRHHALQCGYCTPGMLVTARNIVLRLGAVEEGRIREELAGNLCRCTGYRGIVRAVAEVAAGRAGCEGAPVLREMVGSRPTMTESLPTVAEGRPAPTEGRPAAAPGALPNQLSHTQPIALPFDQAWAILSDPARAAACLPGATLDRHENDTVEGHVAVSLGPITARLAGSGRFAVDPARYAVRLTGQGRDGANAAQGEVAWRLEQAASGCVLHIDLAWRLTGPLAQFSRPALLQGLVRSLAADFAAAMQGRGAPRKLSALALLKLWLRSLFSR